MNRTVIIIPALNAGRTLPALLNRLLSLTAKSDILVINDGSTDDTESTVEGLGIRCISRGHNSGKGAALSEGFRAVREDETVAAIAGKTVVRFKVQAFVIGAVVAGLAGVLFGHYLAYVEPNMFLPQETLFVWLALILGGSGNNRGAILGAVLLLGLLEGSRFVKDLIPFLTGVRLAAAQQMLVGVLLVALMIRRPEGLLPER